MEPFVGNQLVYAPVPNGEQFKLPTYHISNYTVITARYHEGHITSLFVEMGVPAGTAHLDKSGFSN